MEISGTTTLAAVIGSPVEHSLTPALMNAAFAASGLDWSCVAFEVAHDRLPDALVGVRSLGIGGLSVTMPHKESAAACVDRLSPDAELLGAVNCIVNDGGALTGHNTDGEGFVRSVAHSHDFDVEGRRCVVLGAGGAARSIVLALARHRAEEIVVINRTIARAERCAALAGVAGRVVALEGAHSDLRDADLIVNATSVGMADGAGSVPFDTSLLHDGQLVIDIVYRPLRTALLEAARARGAAGSNGVAMLAHQAAIQFELWTGADAPIDVMLSAVADSLG